MLQAADAMLQRHAPNNGKTLVIGSKVYENNSDRRTLYYNAVGIDMLPGEGVDIVHNLEIPLNAKYDHIDCCSVLEHVKRPWVMAENIESLMNPGATILLAVPFMWRVHGYPSDYWRFTKESLGILFPQIKWTEKSYHSAGQFVDKVPSGKFGGDVAWFRRSELAAWGVKCA